MTLCYYTGMTPDDFAKILDQKFKQNNQALLTEMDKRLTGLRTEMDQRFAEFRAEIKTDMDQRFADFRAEIKQDFKALEGTMKKETQVIINKIDVDVVVTQQRVKRIENHLKLPPLDA